MAAYNQFDSRLESLVVETRTIWGSELSELSPEVRKSISHALQKQPELASQLNYERTHTGFIREITVTPTDLDRLRSSGVLTGL